jgi:hypothetical protein
VLPLQEKIMLVRILWALLFALPAAAQTPYAFLRASHYCESPYMMPDYFQEGWGDSIVRASAEWARKELKVKKVDFKLQEALTYHPSRLPEERERVNFSETAYSYFVELKTEIDIPYNAKKQAYQLDNGHFFLYWSVFDSKQRIVLQIKRRIPFSISPTQASDVLLNKTQFKQLYNKALALLMNPQEAHTKMRFEQTMSEEVGKFLEKATTTTLVGEGRGKFAWQRPDTTHSLALELQMPHKEGKTYRREATYTAGKERIQMKALLLEDKPQEIFVQFAEPQLNLVALQARNVLDMAENVEGRNAWSWIAYQDNLVKVYEGDELRAVLMMGEGYKVYVRPQARKMEFQMIGKLLLAEVLVRALQKQYEMR